MHREAGMSKDVAKFDELCAKYWVDGFQVIRPSGNPLNYDTFKKMFMSDDVKTTASELVSIDSTKVLARCLSAASLDTLLALCLILFSAATLYPFLYVALHLNPGAGLRVGDGSGGGLHHARQVRVQGHPQRRHRRFLCTPQTLAMPHSSWAHHFGAPGLFSVPKQKN